MLTATTEIAGVDRHVDKFAATHAKRVVELVTEQLKAVIANRQPAILPFFTGDTTIAEDNQEYILGILQAWSIWFQLLNIAEENTAMRRRRYIEEKKQGLEHIPGTFDNILAQAAKNHTNASEVQNLLANARIRPTITAHPTEAKRVTVLEIHRRIYLLLKELENERWTARERSGLIDDLRNEIDLLWLTGELRLEKPTVKMEVAWGLHFFEEALFQGVPEMLEKLSLALARHYPEDKFEIPPFFQFGTWIGGDRDGNPFVTNEVTKETLLSNRRLCLQRYQHCLRKLVQIISISKNAIIVSAEFDQALQKILAENNDGEQIVNRNPGEVFRQYVVCIQRKLDNTIIGKKHAPYYADADELSDDLRQLEQGLMTANCQRLAEHLIVPLRREVEAFRFCTVRLDLRENSTLINHALLCLWRQLAAAGDATPPAGDSEEWYTWLISELDKPYQALPQFDQIDDTADATIKMFRIIHEMEHQLDRKAFGNFILSMTKSVSDILGVYVLAKYAKLFVGEGKNAYCRLAIVPLFETIDDLRRSPAIMEALFNIPVVMRSIQSNDSVQEVMIGYSDSNKDGGYFTANWELTKVQKKLTTTAQEAGIEISFFHGRGGSVSRGGGPLGRAIAAQPAASVNGRMRITEQGEVVSGKFANRGTAQYNMELLAASIFEHTLKSTSEAELKPNTEMDEAMEELSQLTLKAYKKLIQAEGLLDYYTVASPVEELSKMNIGSRPARRGNRALEDLRAIPWVFAWTQNRHLVTSWYGIGSGLEQFIQQHGEAGKERLQEMFNKLRIFRLIIDEVEKSLPQVDIQVAAAYSKLLADDGLSEKIFTMIKDEYELSQRMVLQLTGEKALLERFPKFKRKLERRQPILNKVGFLQVRLVEDFRRCQNARDRQRNLVPLLLSINCVSAGLGRTG